MLIEFRVKNFRSLRDEQVLSLVASTTDKAHRETNTMPSGVRAAPHILRSAVIYGPNAGGKSNLVKALQYMRGVVVESASVIQPGQAFNVQPFRLDNESIEQPTEFEVTFVLDGVRYQYGFTLNAKRIIDEFLLVYKAFKPQQWFVRKYDSATDKDIYEFGSSLKGQKSLWEGATRSNALFLSMAVQLNSEQLRPIYDWLASKMTIFNDISPLNPQVSVELLRHPKNKRAVCDFMVAADISIADINVVSQKGMARIIHFDLSTGVKNDDLKEQYIDDLQFHHVTEKGKAVFALGDESTGTQRLLYLTGPIMDILDSGRTLIVDELDNSLHPLLVRRLVDLFHNPKINSRGAQLIFSTHDTSLLDRELFRRDQIWFVEKDRDQASKLYPLSDFSPRNKEALERGYLSGRYGALPFFSEWKQAN